MNASITLARIIEQEQQSAQQLVALLQQEELHLIEADIDALQPLTEQIAAMVAKMSELALQRQSAMAANQVAAGDTAMKAWLASEQAPAGLAQIWVSLMAHAMQAKELNQTNGTLIGRHLARNQSSLFALQGGSGQFYGPNGQSTIPQGSRSFAAG